MATDDKANVGPEKASDSRTARKTDWEAVHAQAMEEYERDYQRERDNIDAAYDDLKFRRGLPEDQWEPEALKARKGRPAHVINEIPQYIRQVTGDLRQAKPGIKVVPVDDKSDPKTAEILGGMVRYIENRSYAQHVYMSAADSQVTCGIGHWAVEIEYAGATTFNREIRISAIDDGVAVVWDADSILPTREDAKHVFVPVDMSMAKFKATYPNARSDGFEVKTGTPFYNWHGDDFIRVAAYWVKRPSKKILALMPDGSVTDITEKAASLNDDELAQAMAEAEQAGIRIEERDSFTVYRYLMTSAEILQEDEWEGNHIPVVPIVGEEVRIGRDVYRHGIVRYAKEVQRMVNYYASAETEAIALQPKAPWIGTKKHFQDNYDLWETANVENHPFLEYTPDPQAPAGPQRVPPPVASQAIQLGAAAASAKLQSVIGIYSASLGGRSNETSGRAIRLRDAQADTGTYVYHGNFALALQRTGQIIVDLIPHVYDSTRTVRIVGDDGKVEPKTINREVIVDGAHIVENDLTVGAYDVMTVEGPSYATMRDEAREGIAELIRALPQAAPILGDIYARMQNWPDADKIGDRLEALLPPPVKAALKKQNLDPNAPPEPPTPEEQQAAAEAQLKQQAIQIEMEGKQLENEQKKVEIATKARELQQPSGADGSVDAVRAQAELIKAQNDARMAELEIAAKEQELQQKQRLGEVELQIKLADLELKRAGVAHSSERHATQMAQDAERHQQQQDRQAEPVQ